MSDLSKIKSIEAKRPCFVPIVLKIIEILNSSFGMFVW